MRGVFYRSDTRTPDIIFPSGFQKRDASFLDPQVRFFQDSGDATTIALAPDIEPQSAVCFTRHFEAAAIFPIDGDVTESWIYVLNLQVKNIMNTQATQYAFVSDRKGLGVSGNLWPMFGQERCANSIAAGDIVGAVRFTRRMNNKGDFFNGGTFSTKEYRENPQYSGDQVTADLAKKLITPLVQTGGDLPIPTQAQGIVKSTST